jgi:hypothetical protein
MLASISQSYNREDSVLAGPATRPGFGMCFPCHFVLTFANGKEWFVASDCRLIGSSGTVTLGFRKNSRNRCHISQHRSLSLALNTPFGDILDIQY